MHVLVTGGAGFIGSNFVRYWAASTPWTTRSSSTTRSPTPATWKASRTWRIASSSSTATSATSRLSGAALDDNGIERDRPLRRGVPQQPGRARPGPLLHDERDRHPDACSRRRGGRSIPRFHHISTCEVYGDLALDSPDAFTESDPVPAAHPLQRVQSGGRPRGARIYRDLRTSGHDHQLLQQLRALSVPREGDPALHHTGRIDDEPLPLYMSTQNKREWLHVDDHCSAIELVLECGRIGETYHVGSGEEATIEQIADAVLTTLGQAGEPEVDRGGPAGTRPQVPARQLQDRATSSVGSRRWLSGRGLSSTVEWYAANRSWWEPLLDRAPVVESAWGELTELRV